MNCCDATGRCTGGAHCAARGAEPRLRLAPGAIEHHRQPTFRTIQRRRELRRWLGTLVLAIAACGAVASLGGFIAGVLYARFGGL